ncbi:hypothetical protein F8388_015811 [Cannabis sativa]|uniref:Uncharacterized protein n=1 Tax=Cannabis sativa TaxID=3483 RepID=A0A7J6FH92_CANSA|nr:hypothetical protein F8388_015811 [Cannabis sativa]
MSYFICINDHLHGACWLVLLSNDDEEDDNDKNNDNGDCGERVCSGGCFSIFDYYGSIVYSDSAPAPTSDRATIDEGIACLMMLVALVLTYLIH